MSRKNVISLNLLVENDNAGTPISGDMSSDITSREVEVSQLDKAIIHCKWAAGPVGEFQVEAQTDKADDWFVINEVGSWAVGALDDEAQIILNELPFRKLRLKFVATSGSGTLEAYLSSKSVGG